MPAPKDPEKYRLYKLHVSEGLKKHYATHPETHKKIIDATTGRKHTEESKKKIGDTHRGKPKSDEHKEKIRKTLAGRVIGERKPRSEETKERIHKSLLGGHASEGTRKKLSEMRSGEKCYWWRGGKSFEPYCPKFNRDLKRRVRKFFGNVCVECGKTREQNKNCDMSVHHVNYDKMVCCNDVKPLFVTLCQSCHVRTTHTKNRLQWEERYTNLITAKYGGKCYVEKQ